jgi:hypothetical protein
MTSPGQMAPPRQMAPPPCRALEVPAPYLAHVSLVSKTHRLAENTTWGLLSAMYRHERAQIFYRKDDQWHTRHKQACDSW